MKRSSLFLLGVDLPAALFLVSCESAFEHADANDDNQLSVKEVDAALAETVHTAGDANQDGIVTYEEWKLVFPKADKKAFDKHDTDGSGLTLEETIVTVDQDGTFDELIEKIDTNSDGIVDETEAGLFYDKYQTVEGDNDVMKLEAIINS
jgi:hypothetical protein